MNIKFEKITLQILLTGVILVSIVFFSRWLLKILQKNIVTNIPDPKIRSFIFGSVFFVILTLIFSTTLYFFTNIDRELIIYGTACLEAILVAIFTRGYLSLNKNLRENNGTFNFNKIEFKINIFRAYFVFLICGIVYWILSQFVSKEIAFGCSFAIYFIYKVWTGHNH